MRKALGYSVGSVVVVGLLLTAMAAPGVGRERAQLAREEVVIRVGLKSLEQATVTVGGPSRVQVNGREMRAPVKFALRAAAKEGGGRQMVTCTAADGTVLHAGLPVSVKAAGGQSGAGELLWLDDPAQVYRGSFEFISADNGQGGQGGQGGQAVTLVNVVSLEDYVAGVVPYEIGASSPDHALRVQAVVARTEAVTAGRRHADSGFDICATTHCQVYQGAARELANPAVRAAVLATAGEVLMYGGRLTGSNYHACCGGYTESAEALWKADIPYQRTVACRPEALGDACVVAAGGEGGAWPTIEAPLDEAAVRRIIENPNPSDYCYGSNGYRWTYSATPAELAASVSAVIGVRPEIVGIEVLQRTPRGAAMLVAVVTPDGRHEIAGELAIRLALGGPTAVKSGVFVVDAVEGCEGAAPAAFTFSGAGYGHGVGLCQYGARNMAKLGMDYKEILAHYYPGTTVERLTADALCWAQWKEACVDG